MYLYSHVFTTGFLFINNSQKSLIVSFSYGFTSKWEIKIDRFFNLLLVQIPSSGFVRIYRVFLGIPERRFLRITAGVYRTFFSALTIAKRNKKQHFQIRGNREGVERKRHGTGEKRRSLPD